MDKLKLAILDMNNGRPNQGMRCIRDITSAYNEHFVIDEFDVRQYAELPDLSYDVYISSGGPGNPLEGDGIWDKAYYQLITDIWDHNYTHTSSKKFVFFICHSFQMACNHFGLASITRRKSTSFGVQPVHKTKDGMHEVMFDGLPDPFHVVESRDWQIVQPDLHVFKEFGCKILALEKIRTHVQYERAIMAVRFSNEFIGTQFHPEADPQGMLVHFTKEENRKTIIDNYGKAKYDAMMAHLEDPEKISLTHSTILPNFLEHSIAQLQMNELVTT